MEPFRQKGNFIGYRESCKAYGIYVLDKRHIEFNRDVTLHEEVVFKSSREIQYDTNIEHLDTPMLEDPDSTSLHSKVNRRKRKCSHIH